MEDTTTAVPVHAIEGVTDATGTPLSTGDRVNVTGSERFDEGEGTVIGAVVLADYRLVPDGELRNVLDKPVRVRVLLDNGTDGNDYTASAGRVHKLDPENAAAKQDGLTEA